MTEFYYTDIEIDNYQIIKKELKKIVYLNFLNKSNIGNGFLLANTLKPLIIKSTIGKWFDLKGLILDDIAIILHPPNSTGNSHSDVFDKKTFNVLNIEIDNCSDNYVKMYEPKNIKNCKKIITSDNTPYFIYKEEDCDHITSYNLKAPKIINAAKIHQVCNNTNKSRIAISFRFKNEILDII